MKSMDDYIKGVHEKYMETQKNNIVYEKVSMKYPKYSPLTKVCGVAACLALICVGVIGFNNFNKMKTNEDLHYATSITNDVGITTYTIWLSVDNSINANYIKYLKRKSDLIAIISDFSVKETDFSFVDNRFLTQTKGDMKIEKVLIDNTDLKEKEIQYSQISGTIPLRELAKDESINLNEWELLYLRKDIPDEEVETTYIKQIPSNGNELEKGKQHLVFLSYDEQQKRYEIFDYGYGIMEYDPTTNMVKNISTGEFEEFDWDLITDKK